MKYSATNRITLAMLTEVKVNLCRNAWGLQHDVQCLGFDTLCALAALFYDPKNKIDSYKAIQLAQEEINISPYSRGFQHAWDGVSINEKDDGEYLLGFDDAKSIVNSSSWQRTRPSDCWMR
jgi:hypothetical protein